MFIWLLHNTVLAALLAGGAAVVCRWRRCGPALRHALWVLVLLRLLLPPGVLYWPWSLPVRVSPPTPVAMVEAPAAGESASPAWILDGIEYRWTESGTAPPAESAVATASPAIAREPVRWWTLAWWSAAGIWALGALAVAITHLRGLARLMRLVRRAEPAPPGVVRHVGEMAAKLGIHPPRARVVAGLVSPLVAGLLRPVLLWPKELQDRLSEDGLKAVLIHELAHLRRRDHWVRWIEMAAACVWWWNPLFRLARRRVRQYSELACDAWVLAVLPRARRAYAEALLQVCETVSRTAEPAPALGINGDPSDIQRRLTMIMRESVSCRVPRRALAAVGALALLAVPGWSLGDPPPVPNAVVEKPQAIQDLLRVGDPVVHDELFDLLEIEVDRLIEQPDRDQKLAELEAQIGELLKEIHKLKSDRSTGKAQGNYAPKRALAELARARDATKQSATAARLFAGDVKSLEELARQARRGLAGPNEVLLFRVIYPLPHAKGEAVAKFLRDNVRGSIVECEADGDRLTVTAPPESQTVISKLVLLVQDLPAKRAAK